MLAALAAGKHVVTANKALLAEHGAKVFAQARAAGRAVAFEGSVGGGIPIVQALGFALAANQVQSIAAIVNGTCNFILTQMTREGLPYEDALRQAQELGYAEADPTLDVDGTDTAHKLAILAQLAFETNVRLDAIPRQGIDRLHLADLKYAGELGYAIKLLALAKLSRGRAGAARCADLGQARDAAGRSPRPVQRDPRGRRRRGRHPLLRPGAGAMPTASAVVGDLIDVVTGRAALPSRAAEPLVRVGPRGCPDAVQPGQEPLLPPLHHRRPARRAGQAGPDPGRAGHQHRQRDPARPRRRRPRT